MTKYRCGLTMSCLAVGRSVGRFFRAETSDRFATDDDWGKRQLFETDSHSSRYTTRLRREVRARYNTSAETKTSATRSVRPFDPRFKAAECEQHAKPKKTVCPRTGTTKPLVGVDGSAPGDRVETRPSSINCFRWTGWKSRLNETDSRRLRRTYETREEHDIHNSQRRPSGPRASLAGRGD